MSRVSSDHAEWAVRLENGSLRLRCVCGWQDEVTRTADIAQACVLHRPLVPPQGDPGGGSLPVRGQSA